MDDRYCRLAREYNVSIQHGELGIAFNRLIDMADVRKEEGCAGEHEVTQLFYDTVAEDSTPKRIMTLNDNIYLFLLVANGKTETAQEILEQFVES